MPSAVLFSHLWDARSMSRIMRQVASAFVAANWQVTIVALGRSPDALTLPAGCTLEVLGGDRGHTITSVGRLARALRRLGPTVAFAFTGGPNRTLAVARRLAFKEFGPATVLIEQNHYSSFGYSHRRIRDAVTSVLYASADAVVACSDGVREDLMSTLSQVGQIRVIHNAHDVPEPLPNAMGAPSGRVRVLTVANILVRKRQDVALRALGVLLARGHDVVWTFVGRVDDPKFMSELRNIASDLGVEHAIRWEGYVEDPTAHFQNSHVFALTSDNEGFGIVLAEAMAHGLPTVSTDCPSGPAEVLGHGEYGLLVDSGDYVGLADAIESILPADRWRHFQMQGLRRAREFSPEAIGQQYVQLATELTGANHPMAGFHGPDEGLT